MTKKITFAFLYQKFRFKVNRHFLMTGIKTIILHLLGATVLNIFQHQGKVITNYGDFLPTLSKKIFGEITLSKYQFIFGGIFLLLVWVLLDYFDDFWEEELVARGADYVKNRLLIKFRHLPFEEREARKSEINTLVEAETRAVGSY